MGCSNSRDLRSQVENKQNLTAKQLKTKNLKAPRNKSENAFNIEDSNRFDNLKQNNSQINTQRTMHNDKSNIKIRKLPNQNIQKINLEINKDQDQDFNKSLEEQLQQNEDNPSKIQNLKIDEQKNDNMNSSDLRSIKNNQQFKQIINSLKNIQSDKKRQDVESRNNDSVSIQVQSQENNSQKRNSKNSFKNNIQPQPQQQQISSINFANFKNLTANTLILNRNKDDQNINEEQNSDLDGVSKQNTLNCQSVKNSSFTSWSQTKNNNVKDKKSIKLKLIKQDSSQKSQSPNELKKSPDILHNQNQNESDNLSKNLKIKTSEDNSPSINILTIKKNSSLLSSPQQKGRQLKSTSNNNTNSQNKTINTQYSKKNSFLFGNNISMASNNRNSNNELASPSPNIQDQSLDVFSFQGQRVRKQTLKIEDITKKYNKQSQNNDKNDEILLGGKINRRINPHYTKETGYFKQASLESPIPQESSYIIHSQQYSEDQTNFSGFFPQNQGPRSKRFSMVSDKLLRDQSNEQTSINNIQNNQDKSLVKLDTNVKNNQSNIFFTKKNFNDAQIHKRRYTSELSTAKKNENIIDNLFTNELNKKQQQQEQKQDNLIQNSLDSTNQNTIQQQKQIQQDQMNQNKKHLKIQQKIKQNSIIHSIKEIDSPEANSTIKYFPLDVNTNSNKFQSNNNSNINDSFQKDSKILSNKIQEDGTKNQFIDSNKSTKGVNKEENQNQQQKNIYKQIDTREIGDNFFNNQNSPPNIQVLEKQNSYKLQDKNSKSQNFQQQYSNQNTFTQVTNSLSQQKTQQMQQLQQYQYYNTGYNNNSSNGTPLSSSKPSKFKTNYIKQQNQLQYQQQSNLSPNNSKNFFQNHSNIKNFQYKQQQIFQKQQKLGFQSQIVQNGLNKNSKNIIPIPTNDQNDSNSNINSVFSPINKFGSLNNDEINQIPMVSSVQFTYNGIKKNRNTPKQNQVKTVNNYPTSSNVQLKQVVQSTEKNQSPYKIQSSNNNYYYQNGIKSPKIQHTKQFQNIQLQQKYSSSPLKYRKYVQNQQKFKQYQNQQQQQPFNFSLIQQSESRRASTNSNLSQSIQTNLLQSLQRQRMQNPDKKIDLIDLINQKSQQRQQQIQQKQQQQQKVQFQSQNFNTKHYQQNYQFQQQQYPQIQQHKSSVQFNQSTIYPDYPKSTLLFNNLNSKSPSKGYSSQSNQDKQQRLLKKQSSNNNPLQQNNNNSFINNNNINNNINNNNIELNIQLTPNQIQQARAAEEKIDLISYVESIRYENMNKELQVDNEDFQQQNISKQISFDGGGISPISLNKKYSRFNQFGTDEEEEQQEDYCYQQEEQLQQQEDYFQQQEAFDNQYYYNFQSDNNLQYENSSYEDFQKSVRISQRHSRNPSDMKSQIYDVENIPVDKLDMYEYDFLNISNNMSSNNLNRNYLERINNNSKKSSDSQMINKFIESDVYNDQEINRVQSQNQLNLYIPYNSNKQLSPMQSSKNSNSSSSIKRFKAVPKSQKQQDIQLNDSQDQSNILSNQNLQYQENNISPSMAVSQMVQFKNQQQNSHTNKNNISIMLDSKDTFKDQLGFINKQESIVNINNDFSEIMQASKHLIKSTLHDIPEEVPIAKKKKNNKNFDGNENQETKQKVEQFSQQGSSYSLEDKKTDFLARKNNHKNNSIISRNYRVMNEEYSIESAKSQDYNYNNQVQYTLFQKQNEALEKVDINKRESTQQNDNLQKSAKTFMMSSSFHHKDNSNQQSQGQNIFNNNYNNNSSSNFKINNNNNNNINNNLGKSLFSRVVNKNANQMDRSSPNLQANYGKSPQNSQKNGQNQYTAIKKAPIPQQAPVFFGPKESTRMREVLKQLKELKENADTFDEVEKEQSQKEKQKLQEEYESLKLLKQKRSACNMGASMPFLQAAKKSQFSKNQIKKVSVIVTTSEESDNEMSKNKSNKKKEKKNNNENESQNQRQQNQNQKDNIQEKSENQNQDLNHKKGEKNDNFSGDSYIELNISKELKEQSIEQDQQDLEKITEENIISNQLEKSVLASIREIKSMNMGDNMAKSSFQDRQKYYDQQKTLNYSLLKLNHSIIQTDKIDKSYDQESGQKKINQYVFMQFLGRGQFGKVKLGVDATQKQKNFAIKIINKQKLKKKHLSRSISAFNVIEQEIAIMKKLAHPNICRLHEVIDDPKDNKLYLIMDFIQKGAIASKLYWTFEKDKQRVLKYEQTKTMDTQKLRKYLRDCLKGIEYLHDFAKVVHRDIKPDNLLVDQNDVLKIADFGISKIVERKDQKLESDEGTKLFTAPEMWGSIQFEGQPTDIWAIGVTFYYLAVGTYPFNGKSLTELKDSIIKTEPQYPETLDQNFKSFIQSCLIKDPVKRAKIQDLMDHAFVTNDGKEILENTELTHIDLTEEELNQALTKLSAISRVRVRAHIKKSNINLNIQKRKQRRTSTLNIDYQYQKPDIILNQGEKTQKNIRN